MAFTHHSDACWRLKRGPRTPPIWWRSSNRHLRFIAVVTCPTPHDAFLDQPLVWVVEMMHSIWRRILERKSWFSDCCSADFGPCLPANQLYNNQQINCFPPKSGVGSWCAIKSLPLRRFQKRYPRMARASETRTSTTTRTITCMICLGWLSLDHGLISKIHSQECRRHPGHPVLLPSPSPAVRTSYLRSR